MLFRRMNLASWPRREYYEHYRFAVPCTYSVTANIDITPLREAGLKLYPTMLYALASIVNRHEEFRTALDEEGQVGIFSQMSPCYTIFHEESETFSTLWTAYDENFAAFCVEYQKDRERYGHNTGLEAKPHTPKNTFSVSMLPWVSFTGFQLNLQKGYDYLLPIFTMGRFFRERGGEKEKTLLPLSVQVHHAVCDGFHVSRFITQLQEKIREIPALSLLADNTTASV